MQEKIPKAEALVIAEKALEKVGLSDKEMLLSKSTGGQQQRIELPVLIAVKPDVILFDAEPTSALDPRIDWRCVICHERISTRRRDYGGCHTRDELCAQM